ncbi:sensor domain-containing diguanylate cyclase [Virgibacillus sp. W0430]|uniref:sensor domain-containing diguanylate cyclase n=1 Tax=Virgibacillus sp. W0430 TaxID=3391580 RepID=UPI003F45C628
MKLSLKHLILFVALLAVVLTLFSSISSGYKVNQESIVNTTLDTNQAYAEKLADMTDIFLTRTLDALEISAENIVMYWNDENREERFLKEAKRLREINEFNSVAVVDKSGIILATSPRALDLKGERVTSEGGRAALREKRPMISKPYYSITDRLIIFISYPVIDSAGNYLGLIGGTIYLEEENRLNDLLGDHFYQDGSYVYVVDEEGRIIYHEDVERINDTAPDNPVVKEVMHGKNGHARIYNSKNIDMLAGYAYVPAANWGIVSQRPTEEALASSNNMVKEMIMKSLPFLIVSVLIILFLSSLIASPLQRLASYANSSTDNQIDDEAEIRKVSAWYFEAIELKTALVKSIQYFQDKVNYFMYQATTDPLTKLTNRRTMNNYLKTWSDNATLFSVILLDIDHFKRVNDTYGHAVGDDVLKYLAKEMKHAVRKDDICCRYGGEEFVLLLPEMDATAAYKVAERLRMKLEETVSPSGKPITISAGIATYPVHSKSTEGIIKLADDALYIAKRTGRNKAVVHSPPKNGKQTTT